MKALMILVSSFIFLAGNSQDNTLLRFSINAPVTMPALPVSVDLSGVDYNQDRGNLVLFQKVGNYVMTVPCQLDVSGSPKLWFLPLHASGKGEKMEFELARQEGGAEGDLMNVCTDKDNITLSSGDKEILKYRHSLVEAPEGISPLYERKGAFIHPLYSPSGKVLTSIQPGDHYHHFGIWNPWTRLKTEGRTVDLWNLGEGQGTVKFSGILSTVSGPVFSGFKVYQEHVDFTAPGGDKTVLNETWDVRAWSIDLDGQPAWLVDFTSTLSCATDSAVELSAYRYGGGIGFRATGEWTRYNSTVLTSEGRTRKDADSSMARWCCLEGETGPGQRSGVVFMSHPANRAHPEPMRVWPEDAAAGRGDLFFEFCPIRQKAWKLVPGKEYVLRYRMIVFDGQPDSKLIDMLWQNFAFPPVAVSGE
jgi:hypothetical protein